MTEGRCKGEGGKGREVKMTEGEDLGEESEWLGWLGHRRGIS